MPLRRDIYPVDWETLALEIKEANDWICQECGQQCRKPGEPYVTGKRELTVAHYFHDYDGRETFLAVMCCPCHLRHDKAFHWKLRRKHEAQRQRSAGQQEFRLTWRLL